MGDDTLAWLETSRTLEQIRDSYSELGMEIELNKNYKSSRESEFLRTHIKQGESCGYPMRVFPGLLWMKP
jgi:hypothetical protein